MGHFNTCWPNFSHPEVVDWKRLRSVGQKHLLSAFQTTVMGKIREICNYALTINKNYKRSAPAVKVKQDHSFLKKKKKKPPPALTAAQ